MSIDVSSQLLIILFLVDAMSDPRTTLVSQLLDSIDAHLDDVRIPTEHDDDDDELWLSGHRSIFSSYGSNQPRTVLPARQSQYEDFHWDLYADRQYHQLAFERDQPEACQLNTLSDWSMRLGSDEATSSSSSDLPRTSWEAIRTRSVPRSFSSALSTPITDQTSESEHPLPRTTTLYCLFQRARSEQHPCRLYRNFSEKSLCDSLTSSSLSDVRIKNQRTYKVPLPRMTLHSPTTFSQLRLQNMLTSTEGSFTVPQQEMDVDVFYPSKVPRFSVDRCLQTSLHETHRRLSADDSSFARSTSVDRPWTRNNSKQPCQASLSPCKPHRSFPILLSLPDLNFVTYYARENPTSLSTETTSNCLSTPMKPTSNRSAPLSRAVVFGHLSKPIIPTSRAIKHGRTRPFLPSQAEETETSSSTCSSTENSTSSSGYSSSTSHPRPSHPLKSCLKRTKVDDPSSPLALANVLAGGVAGDVFTLARRTFAPHRLRAASQHRRHSMPTVPSALVIQRPLREQDRTLSEHDLRSKKSVSFCDEIVRRLITPSTSPTHRSSSYRGTC